MGLESFDRSLVSHDLVIDLKWDASLRAQFAEDEESVLDRYPMTDEERTAIRQRDFRRLYELGFHPYLGSQLARLIYGNAAGPDATRAVNALVESLNAPAEGDARGDG